METAEGAYPGARPERDVYSVSRLNREVRVLLERGFGSLWLEAEISNFARPSSGHWYFTLKDVERVNERMTQDLARSGVRFDKIYIAPEAPGQPSRGRKPSPQFLFDARDEFGLDLAGSYIIGDKLIDLECGWNAGVKASILVRTGYGRKLAQESPAQLTKAFVAEDLPAAAKWILTHP